MMETEHTIRFAADADEIILQRLDGCLSREVQPIAGVAAALAGIAYHKAVVSNSYSRHVLRLLQQTGLLAYFSRDAIFGADRVERAKPHPDLYLLAAAAMSADPAACIVIEDSVPGVTAATAAGMTVIGFTGGSHSGAHHAEQLLQAGAGTAIGAMTDLPAMLAELLPASS
jgi:HAD superfamily hydrolase (TIGR01509 family)